jgi:hypothetical protein
MKRWGTTLVGVVVAVLAIWIVARDFHLPRAIGPAKAPAPSGAATDGDGGLMYAYGDAGALGDEGGALLWADLRAEEGRGDAGMGATMPDGTPVPPLPYTAPRQVRFGVALISYAGAQPGAAGGRPSSRSRAEAKALSDKLLILAQQDFHAAVQQGDGGSSDDLGHVKLGILEPAPEYVLFTLPVDGVGGPVDTPRGYWIIKRLE